MVIHAHFAELNYDLYVFDIVQPYHSDLVYLCEDLRLLPFFGVWSNYGLNVLNINDTYRCGSLYAMPSVTMGSCKSK